MHTMKFCGLFLLLPFALSVQAAFTRPDGEKIPVVDIHTHVFNARDLPIYGLLCAQEYKQIPVPEPIAWAAKLVLLRGIPQELLDDSGLNEGETVPPVLTPKQFEDLRAYVDKEESLRGLVPVKHDDSGEVTAVAGLLQMTNVFGHSERGPAGEALTAGASLKGYVALVKLLRLKRSAIVDKLKGTYPADLFVHHMMDMGKAYKDTPADSFTTQLGIFADLDALPEKGHTIRFVAYDPFRGREESKKLVETAWNTGAAGIKFYPPSGYSPAENDIGRPPRWINRIRKWERSRWLDVYGETTKEQLDDTVAYMLKWAAFAGVPVFAHTDIDTVQPEPDYWKKADPFKWELLLNKEDTDGQSWANLRLCFAHGGGDSFWASKPTETEEARLAGDDAADAAWRFGAKIVELCRTHPNVYLELGCLQSVMSASGRELVVTRLVHELKKEPKLAKKIMYGTDWHMLYKSEQHREYLKDFDLVITEVMRRLADSPAGPMPDLRRDFFAGNALQFLELRKHAESGRYGSEAAKRWTKAFGWTK
jgi:predicted TIM-barrel fold metal-dependent hydrolase